MSWQVHRFRDKIGAWLGDGTTQYLTPVEAKRIAKALNAAARDCTKQPDFSKSEFPTVHGSIAGEQ